MTETNGKKSIYALKWFERTWFRILNFILFLLIPTIYFLPSILETVFSKQVVTDIFSNAYVIVFIIILIIWVIIFQVIDAFVIKPTIKSLKEENNQLRADLNEAIVDDYIRFKRFLNSLSVELKFSGSERISAYKYIDDRFVIICRHSKRGDLDKIRRTSYPANQGVIQMGWQEGQYHDFLFPDFDSSPDEYIKYTNEKYGIKKGEIQKLRMKSRNYLVCSIEYLNEDIAGVLVFESLKKDGLVSKKDDILDTLRHEQTRRSLDEWFSKIDKPLDSGVSSDEELADG